MTRPRLTLGGASRGRFRIFVTAAAGDRVYGGLPGGAASSGLKV